MNHQPQTATQASNSVQSSLQAAMLRASNEAAAKSAPVTNVAPINAAKLKAVVVRRDLLGSTLVFDVDSHVKTPEGEFIDYFDGKGMKTAPIQYYHVAKPVTADIAAKTVEGYAKTMKLAQVHIRQRLVKNLVNRDEQGNGNTVDIDNFKAKLLAAITKAIQEA